MTVPKPSPFLMDFLYSPPSKSVPSVCTTALEDDISERYEAGSNAEAECHSTCSVQAGKCPFGVANGFPDLLDYL